MSGSRSHQRLALLLALTLPPLLAGPVRAQQTPEPDFKALIERGDLPALGRTLRRYLELDKADAELRAYLEANLAYLERGGKPAHPGRELILVRGARNDQPYSTPASSGGETLMLPNTIRYASGGWNARLKRIRRYFTEATTRSGGGLVGEQVNDLKAIIYDHASSTANSKRSVLISTSTVPQGGWGPPFYIIKVAPERAIFNHRSSFKSEREVLLPFWILPHEIVARCETLEQVKSHPLYQESRLKDIEFQSGGYLSGGTQSNWALIEQNIRLGRAPLEGLGGMNSFFPGEGPAVGPAATPEQLARFREKVEHHGARIEWVAADDLRLPKDAQARTYLDPEGRARVLLRQGEPVRALALVDELTHVIQIEQMLKARGAAELDKLLLRAAQGDPVARDAVLRWELKAKHLTRAALDPHDPLRESLARSIRALEAELDPLASVRRADGTIDWKRASARSAGGLAHFTLALFLKELAVVARTGDRTRIEEFFDGLLSTDFYVQYGLFSLGAGGADLAYRVFLERTLARYVRPQFVRSVLRSNVSLAVGMALPELLGGHFDGRAFALDLAGLGLSSTAVQAGATALRWAVDLRRLPGGSAVLTRLGAVRGLAGVGGFVYRVAETAVVLYFGERISQALDEALARRQAKARVREALLALLTARRDDGDVPAALAALAEAQRDYRDLLARPALEAETALWHDLERAAEELRVKVDALDRYRALAGRDPTAVAHLSEAMARIGAAYDEEGRRRLERLFAAHEERTAPVRERAWGELPLAAPRAELAAPTAWVLNGQLRGTAGDPAGERTDLFARLTRSRVAGAALDELSELPDARLPAYAAEERLYSTLALAWEGEDPDLAARLRGLAASTRAAAERDRDLVLGGRVARRAPEPAPDPTAAGFIEALRSAPSATR